MHGLSLCLFLGCVTDVNTCTLNLVFILLHEVFEGLASVEVEFVGSLFARGFRYIERELGLLALNEERLMSQHLVQGKGKVTVLIELT
jgi:hypothetical protein